MSFSNQKRKWKKIDIFNISSLISRLFDTKKLSDMRRILPVFIVFLFLATCQRETPSAILLTEDIGFPSVAITDQNLKTPLEITGDGSDKTGAIFFETSSGKIWLNGDASEVEETPGFLEAKWQLDNREVTIHFERVEDSYKFSFKADPYSDILKWGFNISATPDEYFTGLFERTVDGNQSKSWEEGITEAMNLRGQEVDMIIKPTLSLYSPFYISSKGYGLFIEGTWPGHYDMAKTNPDLVSVTFEGPELNGVIYTSEDPAEIVKAHSLNTGPTIVPPKWAFLPWRWRDAHENQDTYYDGTPVEAPYNSMVVEDMLMMEAYDIPTGLYWIDRPWAKDPHGYADFEWDPQRFPKAEQMIDWIHSKNVRFLLWIAPWVMGDMKMEADQNGYNIPLKWPHNNMDSTNVSLIDFTNPEARRWWQEKGVEKMLNQGVDAFKLDRAEEMVPENRNVIYHDGRTAREVRNDYPVMYAETVYESARKIKGDDFVVMPRAGYTGSSKYSGFWGGDIGSPPEGLRTAIIAVQRSAVMGYPIWGSDIGGYWQGDLDREVFVRWLAFGAFNPIMEVGPTENLAPWSMDSEPHYDSELIAIWRLYAKIHTSLADYSYHLAEEAHETGMPPVRPLFLEYPGQEQAWDEWQTFLYGPDILVSAIWQKGKTTHQLYLPKGESWRDAWNPSEVYKGGQTIEVSTPLHKIPIFIRESSEINLGDLNALYEESLQLAEEKPDLKQLEKNAYFDN